MPQRLPARLPIVSLLVVLIAAFAWLAPPSATGADADADRVDALFGKQNLVAWCVVPFDSKRRGPEERTRMLRDLGLTSLAYDWRAEDVPKFDEEMEMVKKYDVDLKGFWLFPGELNEQSRMILDLLERHDMQTELWTLIADPAGETDEQKVAAAADQLRPLAEAADEIGCTIGLYNHLGWFGEPENQLAIIERLDMDNVGIVYNLHHGHHHVDRFDELLEMMMPHLLCVNINGMVRDGEAKGQKIVPLGHGELDEQLLQTIIDSGYDGPIGILGHTMDDVEERLLDNLEGLAWLRKKLKGESAGDRPTARTYQAQ